jgi:putative two-component system response regulator
VFDALTQKRPYKAAWPVDDAMAEIERQRGTQFDPALVDAFLRMLEQKEPQASAAETQHEDSA